MSSALDLDRFLADLSLRRDRLLRLVGPAANPDVGLLEEMVELGEQLIVADEELRVQQEELDTFRRTVVDLCAERNLLLRDSSRPLVVTDARGVVVQATPAVQQLMRQPAIRSVPRPIATWFEGSDRRTVRAMVGKVVATGEPQRADRLTVRTADGRHLATGVVVERLQGAPEEKTLLRWDITSAETDQPSLQPVVDEHPAPEADGFRKLIDELGAVASALADHQTTEEMFPVILDAALRLVPGAEHAGLGLVGPGATARPAAWSDETARRTDAAQLEAGSGPLVDALSSWAPVQVRDLAAREVPDGRQPGESGPRSALVVPLVHGPRCLGAIAVYADRPSSFDADAALVAAALGSHVSAALARATEVSSLRAGLQSRQLIGGAVGVLVERYRITPETAFAVLVRRSQETNLKLREIARTVLETGQDPAQVSGP